MAEHPYYPYVRSATEPDVLTTFHFYVSGPDNLINLAVFTEVSGLEAEIEVTSYQEGGVNNQVHRLLGPAKVSDITLRNGVVLHNHLYTWFRQVLEGPPFKDKRKNISIVMVGQKLKSEPIQSWDYQGALPIKWSGPQLKSEQGGVAIQTLVLTHQGFLKQQGHPNPYP